MDKVLEWLNGILGFIDFYSKISDIAEAWKSMSKIKKSLIVVIGTALFIGAIWICHAIPHDSNLLGSNRQHIEVIGNLNLGDHKDREGLMDLFVEKLSRGNCHNIHNSEELFDTIESIRHKMRGLGLPLEKKQRKKIDKILFIGYNKKIDKITVQILDSPNYNRVERAFSISNEQSFEEIDFSEVADYLCPEKYIPLKFKLPNSFVYKNNIIEVKVDGKKPFKIEPKGGPARGFVAVYIERDKQQTITFNDCVFVTESYSKPYKNIIRVECPEK
jgi:hypothetical protein